MTAWPSASQHRATHAVEAQNVGLRALGKHRRTPCPLGEEMRMQHLTGCGDETNGILLWVHLDANLVHGWSPVCGTDRVDPLWRSTLPRQVDQPLHLIYLLA
jgi:hypothetical protein